MQRKLPAAEVQDILTELGAQRQRFCEEFLVDCNQTKAAERAGYAAGANARSAGSRLMTNPNIIKYVNHLRAIASESTGITAQRVINEISKIAFGSLEDVVEIVNGFPVIRDFDRMQYPEALREIEMTPTGITKIKMGDKMKGLEMLARHLALFTDNVNLTSNGKDLPVPKTVNHITINHRAKGEPLTP